MNEIGKYEVQKKKLQGLCDEHNLIYSFEKNKYPITLTIKPVDSLGQQIVMFEDETERTSPDAFIRFKYIDGDVEFETSETFIIGDALFTKIKNIFKKLYFYWVQYFFRNVIERELITANTMPVIDEDEADDVDALADKTERLEEFEDDVITDEDIEEATSIVRMENKASTALLERRMNINPDKAEEIINVLEENGVIGAYNNGEDREVLPFDELSDEQNVEENIE